MSPLPDPPKRRVKPPGFNAFAAQYRAFIASPEGLEANRSTRKFLDSLGTSTWGYTIHCTVFTPDSDAHFPLAIAKLNAYVKAEVDKGLVGTQLGGRVNQTLWEKWRGIVVDDRENEGEEIDEIKAAFLARGASQEFQGVERRACIMLDEKGLRSLIDGDESGSFVPISGGGAYMTVVDGQWVAREGDAEYQGWMKVNVWQLMQFYSVLGNSSLYQN